MPGRTFTGSEDYRYGFNGKENDNEVKGFANQQNYGLRIYDSRIAKFLSVDPLTKSYPELTPYQFASNMPIAAIDLDGAEAQLAIDGTVVHGPMDIKVINEEKVKANPKLLLNPPLGSTLTFLFDNPQRSSGQDCSSCDKMEQLKPIPDPIKKANAANRIVQEYKSKADPLLFGGQPNNPYGLIPSLVTGFEQAPGVILPEIAFAKMANVMNKSKTSWNAFRTMNKGNFKGSNSMKQASEAFKAYKLRVNLYNERLNLTLQLLNIGATAKSISDQVEGGAESLSEEFSELNETQAVQDQTSLQ